MLQRMAAMRYTRKHALAARTRILSFASSCFQLKRTLSLLGMTTRLAQGMLVAGHGT
jgi:hypothetical protein